MNFDKFILYPYTESYQMLKSGNQLFKWYFGICMMLSVLGYHRVWANNESIRFAERANLAIRRTVHHLITANGDSTSRIAPVVQQDAHTFTIQLDSIFDYRKLPNLLQQSLEQYDINRGYDVVILNCETREVELGYSFLDLKKKSGVPCNTRRQLPGCYTLKIIFQPEPEEAAVTGWWLLPAGSILALLGLMIWKRRKEDGAGGMVTDSEEAASQKLVFGNSVLDVPGLRLVSAGVAYDLTYREGKLLNLFASCQNQILERDFILKSVWEDEGIIVGRSVDVFVSRLRKMLSKDQDVKIAAVHGIGYRLEVRSNS